MKIDLSRAILPLFGIGLPFLSSSAAFGQDKAVPVPSVPEFVEVAEFGKSVDPLAGKLKVDAALNDRLFTTFAAQYAAGISANEDGSVTTLSDDITADDLLMLEKTARCESTSQGGHTMVLSWAQLTPGGVEVKISSGEAPYQGMLFVKIAKDGAFKCSYSANYITPPSPLEWRFTKKSLTLRSDEFKGGKRLYGWLSVEFDEIDLKTGNKVPLKIEGFFKPVIQTQP